MTKKQWINNVGNSWKGNQLKSMVPKVSYKFWCLHQGINMQSEVKHTVMKFALVK